MLLVLATDVAGELIPDPHVLESRCSDDGSARTPTRPLWDVGARWLVCSLAWSLATYFALVSRSRKYLLVLTVASLIWFGFVRDGCVCSIGATQNVALALGDTGYAIPLGVVAFFVLPLVFTLFFGRTFCAAVCPLGAAQELVAVRSLKVPRWLDHALGRVSLHLSGRSRPLCG